MGKRSSHALAPAVLGWARRAGKLAADLAGVAAGGSAIAPRLRAPPVLRPRAESEPACLGSSLVKAEITAQSAQSGSGQAI